MSSSGLQLQEGGLGTDDSTSPTSNAATGPLLDQTIDLSGTDLQPPRDHYVNTAIKFLQNPRVRSTSLHQKDKFLRQKGLSTEEIELAFKKSGAYLDEKNNKNRLALEASSSARDLAYYNNQTSVWTKVKDITNILAFFSIGAYGLHQLWIRYIGPNFFGTKTQDLENNRQLFTTISQLNENVIELKQLIIKLTELQSSSSSSYYGRNNGSTSFELQELKQELSSIKGLLLNRHQFPSSPGIPSWQMLETEEDPGQDTETSPPATARRKRERKGGNSNRKSESGAAGDEPDFDESATSSTVLVSTGHSQQRKHSSNDSNNGLCSGSSCEVVFMGGKNDSSSHSEPDHSDD